MRTWRPQRQRRLSAPPRSPCAYHARTKHSLERYAAGPETLDWDAQPNPFREFAGCTRTPLPLTADRLGTSLAQLYAPAGVVPAPLTIASVGTLMELSMGLVGVEAARTGPLGAALQSVERQFASDRSLCVFQQRARPQ